jgi:hypothetical protein
MGLWLWLWCSIPKLQIMRDGTEIVNSVFMKDTLQILKGIANDPVPYINTTVLFGLTTMQWDLFLKILIAIPSVIWTWFRVLNEIKKYRSSQNEEKNS